VLVYATAIANRFASTASRRLIYARGDYWNDGYWTKKIQLAALDLPATAKASQELGSKFVLPTSPNEVILQPNLSVSAINTG